MDNLKEWAFKYADAGLSVFPLRERGKRPATANGFKDATTDKTQIERWWKENPNYNIGIATGSPSGGLVVVDVDEDKEKGKTGLSSIQNWMKKNGQIPKTVEVVTGRGGLHAYYFCKTQLSNRTNVLDSVDIRADGGYVVAPPSIHPNGNSYRFADGFGLEYGIRDASDIVVELATFKQSAPKETFNLSGAIPEGTRVDTLFKLTCSLIDKGMSEIAIRNAVRVENNTRCNPPLSEEELEKEVFQAFKRDYVPTHDFVQESSKPEETVLPQIVNFGNLYGHLPEVKPVLIEGILRQGHKMIISSGSKAGKSYLLINLAIKIAEGWSWLGFKCTQGKVLYINMEIDEASILNRFDSEYKALKLDTISNRKNIDIWTLRGYSMPLSKLVEHIGDDVKKAGYSAIIIDPLYKVMQGDENNNSDIAQMVTGFDKLANETGASIIYAHHYSKGYAGDKQVIDRASGAGVFARDPDAIISLSELNIPDGEALVHTGWRTEFVLREFKSPQPVDVWFDFPLHVVDGSGYLSRFKIKTALSEAKKRKDAAAKIDMKDKIEEAYDKVIKNDDGGFLLKDFMEVCDLGSTNTVKTKLKDSGFFPKTVENGKASVWYRR